MPQNNQTLLEKTVADQWQTLPSGLTVLVRPMPGYSSTHVIYATKFGSIDRDFCLNGQTVHLPAGVAHFMEHKMFEDEDGDAFAKYAKTGANANAFTSFDRTCYLFTATQQLDESLDVLLGMVGRPYFTEQTIAKEQGIIGQEIKMYDDSADWRLITGLCECLYHSHPIRSDIAGTVESIAEITPEMLYDCCKAFYAPNNMVLAAAGSTSMEQILAACARHGLMEARPVERVQRLWTEEPMTLAATEKTITMPVSKPCFGIGFKEQPLQHDDLRSEILYDLPEEESGAEEEAVPDYPVTVFFTREGYLKKIPPQSLRTAGAHKLKEGDEIVQQVETRNNVEALFFTDKQQVYKVRLAELEDGKVAQMGIFIPGRLGMDEGENVLSMVITGDYSGFMLFFFASGKCAKIPLSSYATKQNRRKLLKAYSDKEPLAMMLYLPEETELAIRTSASRMLLVGTAQIAAKTTRDSQGVAVVTLKKNQTIASVVPADTLELANPHRYRVRSLPATGALIRAEDEGEQMSLL